MSKTESMVVGVFLAGACPLVTFVACWWSAAVVCMRSPGMSESVVAVAALSGLGAGLALDVIWLRRWIGRFYSARLRVAAAVYATLCVVATAAFMGLPLGTFSLGILGGIYAGRRQRHGAGDLPLGRAALFVASMTAGAALPIGLLVLGEQSVTDMLGRLLGMTPGAARGWPGILLIIGLTLVLFGAQYVCALKAARLACGR